MKNSGGDDQSKTGQQASLRPAICYALVLYTYDYYEWEEVFAVSFDPEKLRSEYESLDHLYSDRPLVDDHLNWSDREETHWSIEEVKFLA